MMRHSGHFLTKPVGRGFTVVELVLSIGVVLVLLGLAIPALGAARRSALAAACLGQMRSHGQVLAMYAGDQDDAWPFVFERSAEDHHRWRRPGEGTAGATVRGPDEYRFATALWHLPTLDAYDENPFHESLWCPAETFTPSDLRAGLPDTARAHTLRRTLSESVFIDPGALAADQPGWQPAFERPTRVSELRFPSRKGVLKESGSSHEPGYHHLRASGPGGPTRAVVVWGDGSGGHPRYAGLNAAVLIQRALHGQTFDTSAGSPWRKRLALDWTRGGVHGRDRTADP
jgi:type II secretory pathway pseudopilin PulG